MTETCKEIYGELVNGDGFHVYDSKGRGRNIALCSVHRDPNNAAWNMGWPCSMRNLHGRLAGMQSD